MYRIQTAWLFVSIILYTWHLKLTGACVTIFEAKIMTDMYTDGCSPVSFPCTIVTPFPYPANCSFYLKCDGNLGILKCPCPPGTEFNTAQGIFVDPFHADCKCPGGVTPKPTTSTEKTSITTSSTATTMTTSKFENITDAGTTGTTSNPEPQGGGGNTGMIIGIALAVLVILVIVAVVLILLWRRKHQDKTENMGAIRNPGYQTSVNSTGSSNKYQDIDNSMMDPTYKTPGSFSSGDTFSSNGSVVVNPTPQPSTARGTQDSNIYDNPVPKGKNYDNMEMSSMKSDSIPNGNYVEISG